MAELYNTHALCISSVDMPLALLVLLLEKKLINKFLTAAVDSGIQQQLLSAMTSKRQVFFLVFVVCFKVSNMVNSKVCAPDQARFRSQQKSKISATFQAPF